MWLIMNDFFIVMCDNTYFCFLLIESMFYNILFYLYFLYLYFWYKHVHVSALLDDLVSASSISTTCCKPAPNGTLTLGAAHSLVNGNIHVISATALWGKLSLFRLWGRERSRQEVTSLTCTEGELVKWERDNWDTQTCAPLPDSSLRCGELVHIFTCTQ